MPPKTRVMSRVFGGDGFGGEAHHGAEYRLQFGIEIIEIPVRFVVGFVPENYGIKHKFWGRADRTRWDSWTWFEQVLRQRLLLKRDASVGLPTVPTVTPELLLSRG